MKPCERSGTGVSSRGWHGNLHGAGGYLPRVVGQGSVQGNGGPDSYVRVAVSCPRLPGALIIHSGDGARLYDQGTQLIAKSEVLGHEVGTEAVQPLPYSGPPFEALLLSPLMALPSWVPFALWTLAAGLALGFSVGLLDGALPVGRSVGWVISLAACSYLPAIRSLMLGENTLLVLMGICGCYLALKRNEEGWAAISLLLVMLKPSALLPVIVLLLVQRHFRAIAYFAASAALLVVLTMFVLGPGWPIDYLGVVLDEVLVKPWGGAPSSGAVGVCCGDRLDQPHWCGYQRAKKAHLRAGRRHGVGFHRYHHVPGSSSI